ncbi:MULTISPECIES: transposase [Cysteiniphilum]|uniref:transposase n=1 Tax=Cysteiniphilum TaxID=2056696 RepID=UPI001783B23F|nr:MULTISPECIES: transposase [Cysteiniphilum]
MSAKLKQTLTHSWQHIQYNLFPWIEVAIGRLTEKNQQLVTILEMIKLEHFIPTPKPSVGRPRCNRQAIARASIAKAIHNLPTTRSLIERLNADTQLRQLCGWEYYDSLPDEATFSRVFAEFAESKLTEKIHEKLIHSYQSDRLIEHISRDSTAISAREKPKKKPIEEAGNTNPKRKRGRPKKDDPPVEKALTRIDKQLKMSSTGEMLDDLPKSCDVGAKTNSKCHMLTWCGYKLHIDTADGDIPISCILTSASLHDSQVSIPLAKMTDEQVMYCYELMDSAYDSIQLRQYCLNLGHVPIIDFNRRSSNDQRQFESFEKERYKHRSAAERVNSDLKDNLGGRCVRVRGHAKVMCHLMFGIIALTVKQIFRLLKPG